MSKQARYRPDDLRRLATDLLAGAGLERSRASALARSLLWYDAVAAHRYGIAGLPDWLARLERGDFRADANGRVGAEHASTAVLEAAGGLPPLVLARAAEIAGQKARDTGAGIVRVVGLPPSVGPAAAVATELAIGPTVGLVLGPGTAQSAAIPASEGLPVVYDSALGDGTGDGPGDPLGSLTDRLAPWTLLAGGSEVLVAAVAVAAFEPLGSFHERVAAAIDGREAPAGWIFPDRGRPPPPRGPRAGRPRPPSARRRAPPPRRGRRRAVPDADRLARSSLDPGPGSVLPNPPRGSRMTRSSAVDDLVTAGRRSPKRVGSGAARSAIVTVRPVRNDPIPGGTAARCPATALADRPVRAFFDI